MQRWLLPAPALLILVAIAPPPGEEDRAGAAAAHAVDTVHVAPPAGHEATDRTSIASALERARPGDTVLFAPGMYVVGRVIAVSTPHLTLLGHPDGTTLRGCDPARLDTQEADVWSAMQTGDNAAAEALVRSCGIFQLSGGHTTVRDLVFEYTRLGLLLGCCIQEGVSHADSGGYRIEGNTFRNSSNGIRPDLLSQVPTVIRGNRFVNVYHAVSAGASGVQVLDNDISAPEPGRVPALGHPSFAIAFGGSRNPRSPPTVGFCENNVIAGNRIDGYPDGILFIAGPGTRCRNNVIRDNTILVRRVRFPAVRPIPVVPTITNELDSTVVGVPLALETPPRMPGQSGATGPRGGFEDNLIEGNHVLGAEGAGVIVDHGSRNRIANNTITGIRRRD